VAAKVVPLLEHAASRPVNLAALQRLFHELDPAIAEVEDAIRVLAEHPEWRQDAANLFVATLRAQCERDMSVGLELGARLVRLLPDDRALRTLVTYHTRAGNVGKALAFLELAESSQWVEETRIQLQARRAPDAGGEGSPLARHFGYRYLGQDCPRTLLLYGDIDMNLIDGSSVWLASIAEALVGSGFHVHFLLKRDIERDALVGHLRKRVGIELIEPNMLGMTELGANAAAAVIESLDGISGGYAGLVLRGRAICEAVTGRKSLWKRTWAYLTDFYQHREGSEIEVDDATVELFADMRHVFAGFLVQTESIAQVMERRLGVPSSMMTLLPPMIPDSIVRTALETKKRPAGAIRIGYSGKLSPLWGLEELIASARALRERGVDVEVHVIGDKFHVDPATYPDYRASLTAMLESPPVVWHRGQSREQALEIMRTMDLAWCYRDPELESSTLELSTKLLESLAQGLPTVVTRNAAHEALLGAGYPLFVSGAAELSELLERWVGGEVPAIDGGALRAKVEHHTISAIRTEVIEPAFREAHGERKRIVVAGTDLKFVGELESYLKRLGHIVKRDEWEWAEPIDITRSNYLAKWADYVFCEWGLAHAVWYSQNLEPGKRLVIRMHQQEVVKRARRFPPNFAMDNVDAITCVAQHIRDKAVADFGWDAYADRVHVTPNFLNTEIFDRPKRDEARFRIAIIGILPSMHKRLDLALDLIEALRAEDPRFELVIKGKLPKDLPWMAKRVDETAYFEEQFARLEREPLAGGVSFSAHDPRLAAWYQGIGCVISPSNFESFHYSIAEGAASGAVPVVWPWEGADKAYPQDWIVKDVDEAKQRILAHLGDNFDAYAPIAEDNKRFLAERYGMDKIIGELTSMLLGSEA